MNQNQPNSYAAFEQFVRNYVPHILQNNQNFSLHELEIQLSKFEQLLNWDAIKKLDESVLEKLRLDLVFLYHGVKLVHNETPVLLDTGLENISNLMRLPAVLVYEDLILFNPLHDPKKARLFCSGVYRETELFFLKTHKNIENLFETLIDKMLSTLSISPFIDKVAINEILTTAIGTYDLLIEELSGLHQMPAEHFQLLRQYFYSTQKEGKGVSGRFSAQTFHFRILLDGQDISKVDPNYYSDIFNNAIYYPRKHLSKLVSFTQTRFLQKDEDIKFLQKNKNSERENNISTISEMVYELSDPAGLKLLSELRQKVDKFTSIHFEMAHRFIFIPNKVQEDEKINGTGGEMDIRKYLMDRIYIHKRIEKMYENSPALINKKQ